MIAAAAALYTPGVRYSLFSLILLLFAGCAATRSVPAPGAAAVDARAFTLLDGHTGDRISWSDLIARAAAADAVFIGESHAPGPGQAFHGAFFADLLAAAPSAAAALEFYERDHQADLDDYLSGVIDWPRVVVAALGKPESDLAGHREIIQASKRAGRPVYAANTPRRYASLARREGYERLAALSAEQRRLFVLPTTGASERYRHDFFTEMGVDVSDPAADPARIAEIDAALRAQLLWDATMADSVARAIEAGARPAVLVVGKFHIAFDGGVIREVRSQRAGVTTFTVDVNSTDDPPVSLGAGERGRADVLVYAGGVGKAK